MTNDEHINLDKFNEIRELLAEDFGLLIDTFIQDNETRLELLSKHVHNQEYDSIYHLAHTMKSSAANIGAVQLSRIAETLERNCLSGVVDSVAADYDRLATELSALVKFLKVSRTD